MSMVTLFTVISMALPEARFVARFPVRQWIPCVLIVAGREVIAVHWVVSARACGALNKNPRERTAKRVKMKVFLMYSMVYLLRYREPG
jgi:hypothetical protein